MVYDKMVAKNSINPNRLLPTIVAATKHILRTDLLNAESLNPLDYGWKLAPGGTYEPVATKAMIAQEQLCLTLRCACRKHGFNFLHACGPCHELTVQILDRIFLKSKIYLKRKGVLINVNPKCINCIGIY